MSNKTTEVKNIDLSKMIKCKVANETDENTGDSGRRKKEPKVTLESITSYNQKLATQREYQIGPL